MQADVNATSEDPIARDEAKINHMVWAARSVAVVLTALVVSIVMITAARDLWQFFVYPLLAAVPLVIGIVSARHIRLTHVDLLRRYQAQLVFHTMELEKMASHDELTGLFNRRHFYDQFREMLERVRTNKQTLALILLDIDGLKQINDEYGHSVGDVMIAALAKVMDKHTRARDVAARLGGDEFAILMPDTDKRGAFALAERLWEELEVTPGYEHEGIRVMLNVSVGVSGYPWGGEDIDEMMHWADSDMYANKVSGKLPKTAVAATEKKLPDDSELGDFDRI